MLISHGQPPNSVLAFLLHVFYAHKHLATLVLILDNYYIACGITLYLDFVFLLHLFISLSNLDGQKAAIMNAL